MKPNWIICSNCYSDGNPEKMRDIAQSMGCNVHWFKYIPFEHDKNQNLFFENNSCTIGYGSIQFIKLAQRKTKWIPGDWVKWEELKCSDYLTQLGEYSIHKNFCYTSLGDFLRRKDIFFKKYSNNNTLFIKPNDNAKSFDGEKVSYEFFDKWVTSLNCNGYDNNSTIMILISEPTKIAREWRTIVSEGNFVTGSQYRQLVNGQSSVEIKPECPVEVSKFAEKIAKSNIKHNPVPVYCVDVCEDLNGDLHMVEIGGINCAGLYDCDIRKIVEVCNEAAIKEWNQLAS